ncbi:MAG: helix-turn-helix domain-containing protein [Sedimentisphaerales bacterium]|nr:helix-turn-helix domain-containing protein [Sedimentisphaerales bacterium]
MDENAIINRIRQLRRDYAGERGKALFAKALGISPSSYNYYENDRIPPVTILWKICQLTGANLEWLVTGQANEDEKSTSESQNQPIFHKITTLLEKDPNSAKPLFAFVDFLAEKAQTEQDFSKNKEQQDFKQNAKLSNRGTLEQGDKKAHPPHPRRWLPVLGRTAAGITHFWDAENDKLPGVTELKSLIERHKSQKHRQLHPVEISSDLSQADVGRLEAKSVSLVQMAVPDDAGICEFVDCPEIIQKYPDAFALRVDGDSMSPRICDGDIVVMSPTVNARDGGTAVVKLCNQIGVTCKIIRRNGEQIHLIAANEKFDTRIYNLEQLEWALAVLWKIRIS